MKVYLQGVGLWGAGLYGWPESQASLRGQSPLDEQARPIPAPELLAAAERRRAPATVRLALCVAQQACKNAQIDPAAAPSVFASSHGDTEITDYLCRELAVGSALSPTKFHNSVHNAASGYWTIATGCTLPANAVSGYLESFACGLLEAASLCIAEALPSLLCAYDIAAPMPMATVCPVTMNFGAALILSPVRTAASLAGLEIQLSGPGDNQAGDNQASDNHADAGSELPANLQALRSGNPIARCLPLLVTLARNESSVIDFALTERQSLRVRVELWN